PALRPRLALPLRELAARWGSILSGWACVVAGHDLILSSAGNSEEGRRLLTPPARVEAAS
ncbi:MAG: hypothetical protein ABI067_06745, partial [Leifsonia sp.]